MLFAGPPSTGKTTIALGASPFSSATYFSLNAQHRYGADAGRRTLHHDCRQRGLLAIDIKDGGFRWSIGILIKEATEVVEIQTNRSLTGVCTKFLLINFRH